MPDRNPEKFSGLGPEKPLRPRRTAHNFANLSEYLGRYSSQSKPHKRYRRWTDEKSIKREVNDCPILEAPSYSLENIVWFMF